MALSLFLAPISAFDEVLAEDPEVNRIEDSVILFKTICASKLLANVRVSTSRPLVLCSQLLSR